MASDERGSADTMTPPHERTIAKTSLAVVLLTRDGCPTTPALLTSLDAAAESFSPPLSYGVVDQGDLATNDPRTGYPTPTILVDGQDVFGLPQPCVPFPPPS